VKAKAAERLADLIDPDRALREAAKLAYSDITELYTDGGTLKPMSEWPAHIRGAVAGVEVIRGNVDKGDGKFDDVLKVKLWDKPRNLEMLFKHLGLLKETLEHTGAIEIRWKGDE
jgi:phage terminase small subunit